MFDDRSFTETRGKFNLYCSQFVQPNDSNSGQPHHYALFATSFHLRFKFALSLAKNVASKQQVCS